MIQRRSAAATMSATPAKRTIGQTERVNSVVVVAAS